MTSWAGTRTTAKRPLLAAAIGTATAAGVAGASAAFGGELAPHPVSRRL